MMRTAAEFERIVQERGKRKWRSRPGCFICNYPVGYVFKDGKVFWDPGCKCLKGPLRERSWQDVADQYNQGGDLWKPEYDKYWGFS